MMRGTQFTDHINGKILVLLMSFVLGSSSINIPARIKMFDVPSRVTEGDDVRLTCEFDLGTETLYAAKWYWNDMEFFRYEPSSVNPFTFYPYTEIDVDLSKSDNSSVYLRNLRLESSGDYSCEVSMDSPLYTTLTYRKELQVIEDIRFRIKMLHVPPVVVIGDTVQLYCEYELANETLYALKWLKDGIEFFRYESESNQTTTYYPTDGMNVDMSKLDNSSMYLHNVSLSSAGNYTCEIYSDEPNFKYANFTKPLQVLVPPSDGPFLMEEKFSYDLGDNVSVMCISSKAKPAPELKWYINDKVAPVKIHDQSITTFSDELEESRLILQFHLVPDILLNKKVVLKCVATFNKIDAVITKEITPVDRYILPQIKKFHIPNPASTKGNVRLQCDYELGNFSEYTVKWMFNREKIIKYEAGKSLLFTYWPDDHLIDVDISKSDSMSVNIRNISLENAGNYTCEVSALKPYIKTVEATKELQVLVSPSNGPFLAEEMHDYILGDNVSISCISGKAKPAPELKWYINDRVANSELTDQDITVYPNELESSRLVLRFHLKSDVLYEGKVNLKCVSTFYQTHTEVKTKITPAV